MGKMKEKEAQLWNVGIQHAVAVHFALAYHKPLSVEEIEYLATVFRNRLMELNDHN